MTEKPPQRRWFSFQLRTLLILMAICCLCMYGKIQWDWYQKLKVVEGWAETVQVADDWDYKTAQHILPVLPVSGKKLSKAEQLAMLQTAAISLSDPKMQVGCIKLIVELHPEETLKYMYKIAAKARGTEARVIALRLIGLHRKSDSVRQVRPLLDHSSPAVRGAAAECLGLIHLPSYDIIPRQFPFGGVVGWIDSRPPIHIATLGQIVFDVNIATDPIPDDEIKLPAEIRERIVEIMLKGETDEERMGAARALVRWQPKDYKFRYAEWGVWLSSGGELELVRSILDEIPKFVHRTGDEISKLESDRVNQIMFINKPIVHITVDKPMAVDISAYIHQGRPWFVFPRPDNYVVGVSQGSYYGRLGFGGIKERGGEVTPHPLAEFDKVVVGKIAKPHDGYPWLAPPFAQIGAVSGSMGVMNSISDVGVRWQSVICNPTKLDWMAPPKVGADPKYQWWERLRQVPTSWVSNAGESERFLYYDGPTNGLSPTFTVLENDSLKISENDIFNVPTAQSRSVKNPVIQQRPPMETEQGSGKTSGGEELQETTPQETTPQETTLQETAEGKPESDKEKSVRHLVLIRVTDDAITGIDLPLSQREIDVDLSNKFPLEGDKVEAKLLELLTNYGLTHEEAMGLIDAWRPQFFATKGFRLLTIMTPADYDEFCPLLMYPQPTEVVRVGIVLQELKSSTP
jgi:hypothetical protein